MCVLYGSFGSKVRPRTVAMGSAICVFLGPDCSYILQDLNRVQVVLSGFSMRLFCPGKKFMWVWLYVFLDCTRACVCGCDGDIICVGQDLNWCTEWW